MKLSQIELFVAVVDNGFSMTRAAKQMFIAQSALSRQLLLFEQELSYPLFQRLGKRLLRLTPFGEQVYQYALDLMLNKQNILNASKEWTQKETSLSIATTHTQAKYFLPPIISSIRQQLPELFLRIEQTNPDSIRLLLEKQQADIAICTETISDNAKLAYESCYSWRHGIVIPKKHRLATVKSLTLAQVANYPLITYVYGFTGRTAIQKRFEQAGLSPQVVLSASDSDVIKTYVKMGFGVGIIAEMAYQKTDFEDLVFKSIHPPMEPLSTGIAWLKNKYLSSSIQKAVRIIIDHGQHFAPSWQEKHPKTEEQTSPPKQPLDAQGRPVSKPES